MKKKKNANNAEEQSVPTTLPEEKPAVSEETTSPAGKDTPDEKRGPKASDKKPAAPDRKVTSSRDLGPVEVYTSTKPIPALKTALVLYELQQYKTELVTVPVKVVTEQIMFSFRSIVAKHSPEGFSVSDEVLLNICKTLLRYHNTLGLSAWTGAVTQTVKDDEGKTKTKVSAPTSVGSVPVTKMNDRTDLPEGEYVALNVSKDGGGVTLLFTPEMREAVAAPLRKSGLPEASINHIIRAAVDNLDRFFIRNVFTPAALRAAMEKDILRAGDLDSIDKITFEEILTALRNAQSIYASVCKIKTLDSFGEDIVTQVTDNKLLSNTFALLKTFHEWGGPSAPMELEVVLRELMKEYSLQEPLEKQYSANGLVGRVTSVAPEFDLNIARADLIAFVFYLMKYYGDFPGASDANPGREDIADIYTRLAEAEMQGIEKYAYKANPLVFSKSDRAALLKLRKAAGTKHGKVDGVDAFGKLENLFVRFFVRRYTEMIVKGETGTFAARLTALIDQRALSRNESWDYIVQRSIQVQSIIFQSFMDTFNLFYSLACDPGVYFDADTRRSRDIMISYLNESVQYFKTTTLSADHPAAIKDVALLFSSSFVKFSVDPTQIFYSFKDSMKNDYAHMIYDPVADSYQQYYLTLPSSGTILDVPRVVPDNVLLNNLTLAMKVDYALIEPFRGIVFQTDAGKALLANPPVADLLATDHFSYFEEQYGSWRWYTSAEEIAREMEYPLSLAESIFKAAPKIGLAGQKQIAMCFTYSGPQQRVLFIDRYLLPMYEMLDPDDYYKPIFQVNWPYAAKISIQGFKRPLANLLQYAPVENKQFSDAIPGLEDWKSWSSEYSKRSQKTGLNDRQDTASQWDNRQVSQDEVSDQM